MRFAITFGLIGILSSYSLAAVPPFCSQAVLPPKSSTTPNIPQENLKEKFNFKVEPSAEKYRQEFEILCWHFDDASGFIIGPNGEVLTQGEWKAFLSPYDPILNPLTSDQKETLYNFNCRFESRRIICRNGQGRYFLSNLLESYINQSVSLSRLKALSESISSYLKSQPSDKPLSQAALKHIAALKKNIVGSSLSSPSFDLLSRLKSGLPAGKLQSSFEHSTQKMDLFFDARNSIKGLIKENQFPSNHAGTWNSRGSSPFVDKPEVQVNDIAQKAVVEALSQNPVGREVLDHFTNRKGVVRLPDFLVGEMKGFSFAETHPGENRIVFNKKYFFQDQSFSKLSRQEKRSILSNSNKMNAWLAKHPKSLASFIKNNDYVLAHELTHAWLDRKIPLGPYNPADELENEYQAFTTEARYVQAQVLAHPKSSLANPQYGEELSALKLLLGNYDEFRARIKEEYLNGSFVGASDIPKARKILEAQEKSSLRLAIASLSWPIVKREALKIVGLRKTESALDRFQEHYNASTSDFEKNQYPKMRRKAASDFPKIARNLILESQKAPEGLAYSYLSGARKLADSALASDRGSAASNHVLVDSIKSSAAKRAKLELMRASKVEKTGSFKQYYRLWYALSYASLAQDTSLNQEAFRLSKAFIIKAVKISEINLPGKAGGDAYWRLQQAKSLSLLIRDQALINQVKMAIGKLKYVP